jgi:GNAT superfamily N-acetyltransferase
MQAGQIELVEFSPDHLEGAVTLSRQAGWPHRLEDWAMVLSLSTGVVALDHGQVAGTILVTDYGRAATINMVIVDEAIRGRGIGRGLMDLALAECKGRECRLVATQEGLPLYTKLGFEKTGIIRQHQGVLGAHAAVESATWATAADIAECIAMDRKASGLDRTRLIARLMDQGSIATLRRNDNIVGFAGLRAFGRGEVAGPVVAASAQDAKHLLSFLFAARPGAFMRVDTSEITGLAPWLADQGLAHVGGGITMCKDGPQAQHTSPFQTFALASQALG